MPLNRYVTAALTFNDDTHSNTSHSNTNDPAESVVLSNGNILLVANIAPSFNSPSTLSLQFLDPLGNPVGSIIEVPEGVYQYSHFQMAAYNGGFLLALQISRIVTDPISGVSEERDQLIVQRYNNDGQKIETITIVDIPEDGQTFTAEFDISANDDGSFGITYLQPVPAAPGAVLAPHDVSLYLVTVDTGGAVAAPVTLTSGNIDTLLLYPQITALNTGDYAVVYGRYTSASSTTNTVIIDIDTAQTPLVSAPMVLQERSLAYGEILALDSGFVVFGIQNLGSFSSAIVAMRIHNDDGSVRVPTINLPFHSTSFDDHDVVVLADGSFVVTGPSGNLGISVQHYTANGVAISDVTPVGTPGMSTSAPVLAAFADGRFSVTYLGNQQSRTDLFDTRDPADFANGLVGDAGQNSLVGFSTDTTILAGAGNDALYGLEGNDTLHGEDGDDLLHGGAGDDTLNGGTGTDIADFSGQVLTDYSFTDNGDGTYTVIHLNDGIDGTDILSSIELFRINSVDYTLEDIFPSFTDGDDTHTLLRDGEIAHGLAGNDIITGLSGNNTLYGDAGDDRLYGLEGDDTLYGGTGADVFIIAENAGNDEIMDFENGVDHIHMLGEIYNFNQLKMYQDGSNVIITTSNGVTTLMNTDIADIDASDFIFTVSAESVNTDKTPVFDQDQFAEFLANPTKLPPATLETENDIHVDIAIAVEDTYFDML